MQGGFAAFLDGLGRRFGSRKFLNPLDPVKCVHILLVSEGRRGSPGWLREGLPGDFLFPRSSSGRTPGSEPGNAGSNPALGTFGGAARRCGPLTSVGVEDPDAQDNLPSEFKGRPGGNLGATS